MNVYNFYKILLTNLINFILINLLKLINIITIDQMKILINFLLIDCFFLILNS